MFTFVDTQLRRHRRKAVCVLVVLALGASALSAHAAMMSTTRTNDVSAMASICLIAASFVAVAAGGALVARRMCSQLSWLIPAPVVPELGFMPAFRGLLGRPGPPPLLQVFRL